MENILDKFPEPDDAQNYTLNDEIYKRSNDNEKLIEESGAMSVTLAEERDESNNHGEPVAGNGGTNTRPLIDVEKLFA